MRPERIDPLQTPAAVNMDLLRAEAKLLASNFKQDAQLSRFGAEILSNLETPDVVENLQTKVFDQLKPEDLEGKPLQLKAAQRFISQFPGVAKTVKFGGEKEAHPLLVRAAVGPQFREMLGQFNETETIQSIAERLNPEMSPFFHEYFEKGTVSPTIAQVPELLKLADQLNIVGLLEVAGENIKEHKVLEKLDAAQLNEWLELALNRNIGWLQLTVLEEMRKRTIAPDATKPKLVALCAIYNKDKNSKCLSLSAEKQIEFTCGVQQDLEVLKQFNTLGLRIESLILSQDEGLKDAVIRTLNEFKYLSHLQCFKLGDQGAHQLTEVLKTNESIRRLNLENNTIGDLGVSDLASVLTVNKTLLHISLGGNNIGDTAAEALAEALKFNQTLKELNLISNQIGFAGANKLAEALKVNTSLTLLNLNGNPLTLEGGKELAQALMVNRTIQSLSLYKILNELERKNGSGDSLTNWIAEALRKNETITELDIGENGISFQGATEIASAITQHPSLEQLYMPYNPIQDEGANQLGKALKSNHHLILLNLNQCSISDAGAGQLAEGLQKNATLVQLDLDLNNISDAGVSKLADALVQNNTLRVLTLALNKFGEKGVKDLSRALHKNTSLVSLDMRVEKLPIPIAKQIYETFKPRVLVNLPYPVVE